MTKLQQATEHARLAMLLAEARLVNAERRGLATESLAKALDEATTVWRAAFEASWHEANVALGEAAAKFNIREPLLAAIEAEKADIARQRAKLQKTLDAARAQNRALRQASKAG